MKVFLLRSFISFLKIWLMVLKPFFKGGFSLYILFFND